MPTGYTAEISKGITFNDFIMQCARNFGACITMRDDPRDAPIPDKFEPSDYHTKALAKHTAELDALKTMTSEMADERANKEFEDKIDYCKRQIQEALDLKTKYTEMLQKVMAWVPPSADHQGLKDFMVDQITQSIDFDQEAQRTYIKFDDARFNEGDNNPLKIKGGNENV